MPEEGAKPKQVSRWPKPSVPQPYVELIQSWISDDGGCEATDGCWVEPDGICPHGHPSWALYLGYI